MVKLLGESVPYINFQVANPDLLSLLGVETTASTRAMLNILISLEAQKSTDMKRVTELYWHLSRCDREDNEVIVSKFKESRILLVAAPDTAGHKRIHAMTVGELFLESLSTGVITEREVNWLTTNQTSFNRAEEATALRLGRLIDAGDINLGCRIALLQTKSNLEDWLEPLGRRRGRK